MAVIRGQAIGGPGGFVQCNDDGGFYTNEGVTQVRCGFVFPNGQGLIVEKKDGKITKRDGLIRDELSPLMLYEFEIVRTRYPEQPAAPGGKERRG